jgi:hypothetical protein
MATRISRFVIALVVIAVVVGGILAHAQERKTVSIEGTYKLMSRKLADGKVLTPPDVQGLQTFTKTYRNFNVGWTDGTGKHFSYSVISNYKLTDKEYSETILYSVMNDEIGIMPGSTPGSGPKYVMTPDTKTSPVKLEGTRCEFKLPFDPPVAVFDGSKLTATLEGSFVDSWEKIR